MKSFNITRFGQTLRWVIAVNYRTMLLWTTGIALITFVAELYILKMSHIPLDLMQSSFGFGIFVMMTAFAFLASYVTSFINEKRRRTAFLALPATNSEKYLSLITYTSVIFLCAVFLALVAGDSLRMLFCWIKYHSDTAPDESYKWYTSTLVEFGELAPPSYARYETWFVAMKCILAVSFILWVHSLYTLGGTVLRKYSFVVATALFISCFVIFIEINSTYHFDWFEEEWIEKAGCYYAYSKEIGVEPYILSVLLPLLTVFNYWASYRTFKGFQVINHKWINL
ncbi:MAG: hypothetical protein J5900_01060 [Prevotella sp.]|nr:hypothetical protein [Prevotella sp.]